MDAVELLRGDAPFVVDTSAWWRFSSLSDDLARLVRAAGDDYRMWITPIVRMEVLYSARSSSEYVELETDLDALRILRNDRAVTDAAMSAIGELAERSDGYHRVPFTDAPQQMIVPVPHDALLVDHDHRALDAQGVHRGVFARHVLLDVRQQRHVQRVLGDERLVRGEVLRGDAHDGRTKRREVAAAIAVGAELLRTNRRVVAGPRRLGMVPCMA